MNKRLSMDKGAWQALSGLPAPDGIQSVADYTHRLHEINDVAGISCGKVDPVFRAQRYAFSKKKASDSPQKWPPLLGPMLAYPRLLPWTQPTMRCSGARAAWARLSGQGGACGISRGTTPAQGRRPEARRDPPRGHRHACPALLRISATDQAQTLHPVLRRPVLRDTATPPTSRSRLCSRAASKDGPTM